MAALNLSFEQIIEEKPTLDELCEYIDIGDEWDHLGILLKLNPKKLGDIHGQSGDHTYKTSKMFELWLGTNPCATRKQVIDALKKKVIEENTIAHEYEEELRKMPSITISICS